MTMRDSSKLFRSLNTKNSAIGSEAHIPNSLNIGPIRVSISFYPATYEKAPLMLGIFHNKKVKI